MSFLWNAYVHALKKHTLATQMATGAVMSGTGSAIAQHAIEGKRFDQHEWYRTRRLATYGGLIFAPIANRWHWVLNKIEFSSKWTTVFARVLTDGLCFAPFATSLFYCSQGVMEGRPFESTDTTEGIKDRIAERLFPTVQKQWYLFGTANLFSMSCLPLYARPPFSATVACAWNVFLATAQNRGALVPVNATTPEEKRRAALDVRTSYEAAQAME
ncbi:hypothetical protein OIO90_001123 [Microbotryomycetes sp. JL221]|nr:hypothetical protein OIO90_001123 [Microbotryomycetes sp. JL221]